MGGLNEQYVLYCFFNSFPGVTVVRLHVAVRTINVAIDNIFSVSLCISKTNIVL